MIAEAIIFDHFFDASASVGGGAAAGAEVGRPHTRGVAYQSEREKENTF